MLFYFMNINEYIFNKKRNCKKNLLYYLFFSLRINAFVNAFS